MMHDILILCWRDFDGRPLCQKLVRRICGFEKQKKIIIMIIIWGIAEAEEKNYGRNSVCVYFGEFRGLIFYTLRIVESAFIQHSPRFVGVKQLFFTLH